MDDWYKYNVSQPFHAILMVEYFVEIIEFFYNIQL